MKTKLLLITFLCLTQFLKAQIVNIPDNEFKQALLNYSPSIDTNNDNEIQVTEAESVTNLTITDHQYFIDLGWIDPVTGEEIVGGGEYYGISDFTGIEAFINLTYLNCSTNDLTSLNLSTLTQLEYLDCSNNINYNGAISGGAGIATLNLPINTTLQTLTCNSNNETVARIFEHI